jgi:hypothetical protein
MACTGESLDVGETDGGTMSGTGGSSGGGGTGGTGTNPGEPLPEWPLPNDCVPMNNHAVAGVWEGAIQDMQFRNQIPLRVEILGASELGGVCGTLRWGEGTLPPPPTDPERGWPEGQELGFGGAAAAQFQDGATYTILDGGVRDDQVRFRVTAVEFWKPWCEIQTPHWQSGTQSWQCIPEGTSYSLGAGEGSNCLIHQESGPAIEVDGGKCGLCLDSLTCPCNEEGCAATPLNASGKGAAFDLVFELNRATGTVLGGSSYTDVLLNRVE